ncbi:TonB-dependent receptor plug domain-containing protein [Sphingomicrobium astaxanthinifaciens]|uniref:TonB-dependent receptor plug domain-containing protein n=1 Tax=Sphingomicrobium astaxanthinifaciens TaxID=1227949 RepID=UPI001FCB8B9B|nr:TonB-dependent receptor [Sphingomicrobium astaxanthinifaciens]MCJ7421131.1 TonB-dependent receptor plug domain-containing protein [Sphingomicrobium astaxanthinifaciens]
MRHLRLLSSAALALVLLPAMASAQQADSVTAADRDATRGARVYTYADLAQYAPQTALDMVNRIPGFAADGGNNRGNRGLGQASQNILLNGARVSGKSNNVFDVLGRISARDVVRIEIVDGATLDVPGLSGEVANVIYEAGGISGTFEYRAQFRPRLEDTLLDAKASISGGDERANWSLSLETNSRRQGHWGPEVVTGPDGALLVTRDEFGIYNSDSPEIAGSYSRRARNGNEFNANASAQLNIQRNRISGAIVEADGTRFEELFRGGEDEWNAELGLDYAFDLGPGRLKLIGLQRNEHSPVYDEFGIVGGRRDRFEQVIDENESIVRGEYGWSRGQSDWELSLEGAYNSLSQEAELIALPATGSATVTLLPGNRIEELRSEAIASLSRPLSPRLSLQLNGGAEFSSIAAGAADPRAYLRPKGSAALSWRASDDVTIDAKLERVVDQLNFFDFLAAVDVQDGQDRGRNNEIVPPQRWRARVEGIVRLGAYGSLTPYAQGEIIEDVIEAIPTSPTEEALGNAGDATAWVVGVDGTILLAPLGVAGARLDLHAHTGDSRFTDPLLGTTRALNGQEYTHARLQYRHDLPGSDLAYGGSIQRRHMGGSFRLDQFARRFNAGWQAELFVEHKDVLGLQVTAGVNNLFNSTDNFERIAYVDRRDGPIAFFEDRAREYGRIVYVNVAGRF